MKPKFSGNYLVGIELLLNHFGLEMMKIQNANWKGLQKNVPRFIVQVWKWHQPFFLTLILGYHGAEFWVQIRSGQAGADSSLTGLEFHFDKDEMLFASQDIWKHPILSTVCMSYQIQYFFASLFYIFI